MSITCKLMHHNGRYIEKMKLDDRERERRVEERFVLWCGGNLKDSDNDDVSRWMSDVSDYVNYSATHPTYRIHGDKDDRPTLQSNIWYQSRRILPTSFYHYLKSIDKYTSPTIATSCSRWWRWWWKWWWWSPSLLLRLRIIITRLQGC